MSIPQNFNSIALLKIASERCGLSDFGDDDFRAGLDKFVQACVEDGYVPAAGLEPVAEALIRILVNRLRFEDDLRRHPEILEEKIVSPLIIVGAPGRVGSTKLHRILANAANIQTIPLWQVMNPVPTADAQKGKPDPRIKMTEDFCERIRLHQPQLYAAIQTIATEPDEDPYLLDMTFMQFMFNALAHVPSYMQWIYRQDWLAPFQYYKKLLQYVQWQNGTSGKPMLLKGPSSTAHIDVLFKLFPDARFVQIHRDPVTCIASMAKVVKLLHGLQPVQNTASLHEAAKLLGFFTRHHLLENLRIRADQPEIPIIDAYYQEVCDDAIGLCQKLFDFWGVDLSSQNRQRMCDWELANSQHKLGKFEYTMEESGLDREEYEASIGPYMTRFFGKIER